MGADTYWAVALGDAARAVRGVPDGIPFLVTAVPDWPNPLVLGETLLSLAERFPSGLPILGVVVVAVALLVVAAQAHFVGRTAALPVAATVVGTASALVVVRLPSLSLVPFVLLCALLRAEHERRSRRIWLVVPLLALWSNLPAGGFVIGLALVGVHLALSRLRCEPMVAVLVGLAAVAATLVNTAGLRTVAYVVGVFANEAARRGTDLWARPDLTAPLTSPCSSSSSPSSFAPCVPDPRSGSSSPPRACSWRPS